MTRITQRDLEAVCARINFTVNGSDLPTHRPRNLPGIPYGSEGQGGSGWEQVPNAYSISYAYGGAALHRNCDVNGDGESHGIHDVFGYHMPKRELYDRMQAFLRGIETIA